ncbi:MAG: GGGtGRT protein [Anaerobutyricum sp.]
MYNQIKGIQPICFENACWAYIMGAATQSKRMYKSSRRSSSNRRGLQAFQSGFCSRSA